MDQNELNKMMADIFGSANKQEEDEQKFYLYYNTFGKYFLCLQIQLMILKMTYLLL